MSSMSISDILDINAIVACCKCDIKDEEQKYNGKFCGMGYNGQLPWSLNKTDMNYFTKVTTYVDPNNFNEIYEKRKKYFEKENYINEKENYINKKNNLELQNVVIMGRLTWESIPAKFKPLNKRINIILTRSELNVNNNVYLAKNIDEIINMLRKLYYYKCFIIGGSNVYKCFLEKNLIEKIYFTRINHTYNCDVYFPKINEELFNITSVSDVCNDNNITMDFIIYSKKSHRENEKNNDDLIYCNFLNENKINNIKQELDLYNCVKNKLHPEYQYLNILYDVIKNGCKQSDRTGVGVISKFGYIMRYNIGKYLPLLTTKKLFVRGIIEELLWFIKGDTNGNKLLEKNVRIWEANGTREFLDNRKLFDREVNDLGPIYGFQWRHFGAEYTNMHDDYQNKGVDQLANIINLIKNDPTSRRIILCAWNPVDLDKMALPPCHILCQFYVHDKKLSCIMYQRSCDLGLGVPFNIASYSIFTYIIAQICNLKPYEFIHVLGNAHVYNNHIEPLLTQINRIPYPFPTMKLNPDIKNIEDFTISDFTVHNYVHHDKITMEMAA